ncbi:flavodoxin, partial [gut metagenome]
MYKLLGLLVAALCLATATFAQSPKGMNKNESNQKVLVAYFSATGNTARAAQKIAAATGGDLYAITPAQPYNEADLDWRNEKSRSSVEMNNPKARPALGGNAPDISSYDVIFIGYPIWWDLAPRIILTFIESKDWQGKTVIPFATSGSSSISNSAT